MLYKYYNAKVSIGLGCGFFQYVKCACVTVVKEAQVLICKCAGQGKGFTEDNGVDKAEDI